MPKNVKISSILSDAMARVGADLKNMPPEQLKKKLAQHQGGMFSQIAQDMEGFSNHLLQRADDHCKLCGEGVLQDSTQIVSVEYRDVKGEVVSHLSTCDFCGSEQASASQVLANKNAIVNFKTTVDLSEEKKKLQVEAQNCHHV